MNAPKVWSSPLRALWLVILLSALPLLLSAAEWPASREMRGLERRSSGVLPNPALFAGWQILWSPALEAPVMGLGTPVDVGTPASPEALLTLVTAATGTRADLEFVKETSVLGRTLTHFRERRDKLPVLAGRADVVRNARGQINRWSLRTHERWPLLDSHLLDAATAAQALTAMLTPAAWELDAEGTYAAWFPDADRQALRPVYWVRVAGKRPHERWEGIVDATSGEVLLNWSGVQHYTVSGTLSSPYWQPYIQSPVQTAPCAFETVYIDEVEDTTDAYGVFAHTVNDSATLIAQMASPYTLVMADGGTPCYMTRREGPPYSPLSWNWTVGAGGVTTPELNLYYHMQRIHSWYKGLDASFDGMDYPVPAVANYGGPFDNAFWSGYGVYFGGGSFYQNFAMFSDVVYHEYTHGVTSRIYTGVEFPYDNEPGALNEAWSDYIGCTVNNDPYMGEYIGGSFNSWFRNLLQFHTYPDDWVGEVHDDSRFISEALWTLRTELGAAYTDSLAHYARYELSDTFIEYLIALVAVDADLSNGSPNGRLISNTFRDHGIGSGDAPVFELLNIASRADGQGGSAGDGDRFLEPGETIALSFDLTNAAILYPPPATGIVVTVHVGNPALTVENGVQPLAELAAGDTHTFAPVQLHIDADAPRQWVNVIIGVTANDGATQYADTLEFMIGAPQLLLVEADAATDVEGYVRDRLHTQGLIYDRIAPGDTITLDDTLLPNPGVVFWLSGNAHGPLLTAADQALISRYIAAGNRVVLSGQDLLDDLAGSAFLEDSLGVAIASDSLRNLIINGLDTPFASGELMILTGSGGAGNQHSQTTLALRGDSRAVACYAPAPTGPLAAVEGAHGRALIFGFGIEAISAAGTSLSLATVLDRIFVWASDVLPLTPRPDVPTLLPTVAMLGPAYPNPFNSSTNLSFTLPAVRGAELLVYDVLGRIVDRQRVESSMGTLRWTPQMASGVYFAQLRWDGGQTQPVKLLLVR